MERIVGKHCHEISTEDLRALVAAYSDVLIDLGTGDGRFVLRGAQECPRQLVIGIDACRENLRDASRRAPANTLFLIANALDLPNELTEPAGLTGLASAITINFPWGTLLTGLLRDESPLLATLHRLARPGATLDVRLNAGALAEAGWSLEAGGDQVRRLARVAGFRLSAPRVLAASDLRSYPTTWARRLAFGRDPRALALTGRLVVSPSDNECADWQQSPGCAIMRTLADTPETTPETASGTMASSDPAKRGTNYGTRILDKRRRRAAGYASRDARP